MHASHTQYAIHPTRLLHSMALIMQAACTCSCTKQCMHGMPEKQHAPYMHASEPAVMCAHMSKPGKACSKQSMACKAPWKCQHQRTQSAQPHATRLHAAAPGVSALAEMCIHRHIHGSSSQEQQQQRSLEQGAPTQPVQYHYSSHTAIPTVLKAVPVPCSSQQYCSADGNTTRH